MSLITGAPIVSGLAVGRAVLLVRRGRALRAPVAPAHVDSELRRLEGARERTREQLTAIRARLAAGPGADLARMFDAQLLMLDDPLLVGRAVAIVTSERVNAEWAIQRACDEVGELFAGIDDEYLRERGGDVADLVGRLRMNLQGTSRGWHELLAHGDGPFVVVADDPPPSVAAQLDWSVVSGLAIDAGSRTSHTAILARSLGVPAVVGLHDVSRRVPPGASVIIDGETGEVVIDPTPALWQEAEGRSSLHLVAAIAHAEDGPLQTSDGETIVLQANIERSDDVPSALSAGAEGIGLYRSEFMLVGGPPDMAAEEEQYHVYRQLVERMGGRPVTIRTFDVDERQLARPLVDAALDARWFPEPQRSGHAGLRGVRFGLAQPRIFKTQLRALLRAAAHGPLRIMFPFVSSVQEVRDAKNLLLEAQEELTARGLRVPDVPVGIMIEVPSAAFTASLLAKEADFFTIGTNDLIQYTLAVDRTDDRVSNRYEPLHPAILRLLRHVRRAAARQGIVVSVCGEMASDPLLLKLLIGCGLREFSMTPGAIPMARRVVKETSARQMMRVAARVLTLGTVEEIEQYLGDEVAKNEVGSEG